MDDGGGEFALIRRHFARPDRPSAGKGVALGIGDDCALLQPPPGRLLAISSDLLIEGRHFFAGTDPAAVGHKSLAVNLSDLAAMGAEPLGFTLAIALPAIDDGWLEAFCRGLFALADAHDCPLVGGDTTRGPLAISVTIFGSVTAGQALRRDAAEPGDDLWVTGPLGAAALAVRQRRLGQVADPRAARRLDWPEPRLNAGAAIARLAGNGLAHAAIDLSDGLAGDLGHVLEASSRRLGRPLVARLDEARLPIDVAVRDAALPGAQGRALAMAGGDDYELLFTAPLRAREAIPAAVPEARRIGAIDPDASESAGLTRILLAGEGGRTTAVAARAFDHFADPPED